MPGEFDEAAGLEIIKDSMGLTDSELGPQGDLDDSDNGEPTGGQEEGFEHDDRGEEVRSYESHEEPQQRQVQQREAPPQDPLRANTLKFDPRATFRQDAKGNLVDAKTGEVIARSGSEARIYQRVHKQATDYIRAATGNIQNQMQAERSKLDRAVEIGLGFEQELQSMRQTFQQLNAHELQKDELLEAAAYFKQAKSDPVGVLKNLLTRAALGGIDITQLGMDGNQFDARTLVDMMKKEIGQTVEPVRRFTEQQQQERQARETESQYLRQAETQVNTFFGQRPEAVPYTHIFHAVLSQPRFQNMSLGEIWDKVQLHLIRNGVDPRQAPSRSQRQRLNGTRGGIPSRSPPNGQGMAPNGGDRGGRGQAGPAHPSMSYDAIIREVLGAR